MKVIGLDIKINDKRGFYIACLLFLLQFVYFQFQESFVGIIAIKMPLLAKLLLTLPVADLTASVRCLHIIMHALFSIAIVWFLHKDKGSTMLVVYMSAILFVLYVIVQMVERYTEALVIELLSVTMRNFLTSPFKTIFSVPALFLRNTENVGEQTTG